VDDVAGFNVMVIAIQVPKDKLTAGSRADAPVAVTGDNSIIGLHDSVERLQNRVINGDGTVQVSGPEMQVSRLGAPLVNEVVIPLKDKDKFNATKPTGDVAAGFGPYVTDPELPKLFNLLYGIPVPATPRNDLVAVFLTGIDGLNKFKTGSGVCEELRLNMSIAPAAIPNRFGVIAGDVAGFPNGRRLSDDVVDIEERAAAGGYVLTPATNKAPANQLGDGVDFNDVPLLPYFPYAALPHNPISHEHHILQKGGGQSALGQNTQGNQDQQGGGRMQLAGPNPASTATLEFTVTKASRVSLKVYDALGREVRTLINQDAAPGTFRARWDGRSDDGTYAGRGVYFARFVMGGETPETKKIVLE